MIPRQETASILRNLSAFPMANIIGPRQVGKTMLAKRLMDDIDKPTVYLDLQDDRDRAKLASPSLYLETLQDHCVVIDEVQLMPELYGHLRSLIDRNRKPARFILLGSASPEIIKGVSETLAGRVFFCELAPLSLLEVESLFDWKTHILQGGYPQPLLLTDPEIISEWYKSYTRTFVELDILSFGFRTSPVSVMRLLRMISHFNGQLLNVASLSNSLDVGVSLVKNYLDLLEGGFLIRRLQPYYINSGKRLVKSPKLYIRDSGIALQLERVQNLDGLFSHPQLGAFWEAYVIEQITRVTQNNWEYYFYRTQQGAESDLVLIAPDGKLICVEIKFSTAPSISKGFYQSIEDLKPKESYVIIPEGEVFPHNEKITVTGLLAFLKKIAAW